MIALETLKKIFGFLYEQYGEKVIRIFNRISFEIAKSEKYIKIFTITGFSIFSSILIFTFLKIISVNENIRTNQELSRLSLEHIESSIYCIDGLLQVLALDSCKLENYLKPNLKIKLQELGISGFLTFNNGQEIYNYGQLDPTNNDTTWNINRWNEITYNLTSISSSKPETYLVSYERNFRSKEETSNGINYYGSLIFARVWKSNKQLNGIVVIVPINKIANNLRISAKEYESGDYDYIINQDGNLIYHPTPYVMFGTDENGKDKRGAGNKDEVGEYPINTRDADWISENNILNTAYCKMIEGVFTSVIYKNLKGQFRLTSFNLIEFKKHEIKGMKIGLVTGKGLCKIDAIIGSFLLKSPSSINQVLFFISSLYVLFISFWLFLLNRIRKLQSDILLLSPNMTAETSKRLKFIPISSLNKERRLLSNYTIVLISVDSENFPKELTSTINISEALSVYFQGEGWVTERLSIKEFIVFKEFEKSRNSPSIIYSNVKDYLLSFDINGVLQNNIHKNGLTLFYTVGDIHFDGVANISEKGALLNFSGQSIYEILELWEKSKINMIESNTISLYYSKEIAKEKCFEKLGDLERVLNIDFLKLKSNLINLDIT